MNLEQIWSSRSHQRKFQQISHPENIRTCFWISQQVEKNSNYDQNFAHFTRFVTSDFSLCPGKYSWSSKLLFEQELYESLPTSSYILVGPQSWEMYLWSSKLLFEQELYESSRRKPGWRFTAGVQSNLTSEFWIMWELCTIRGRWEYARYF